MKTKKGLAFASIIICAVMAFGLISFAVSSAVVNNSLNKAVEPLNAQIVDLNEEIAEKEAMIIELQSSKAALESRVVKLEWDITVFEEEKANLTAVVEELNKQIAELDGENDAKHRDDEKNANADRNRPNERCAIDRGDRFRENRKVRLGCGHERTDKERNKDDQPQLFGFCDRCADVLTHRRHGFVNTEREKTQPEDHGKGSEKERDQDRIRERCYRE
jgi:septal ring factor EnvC (AmiA/AmiB activator)